MGTNSLLEEAFYRRACDSQWRTLATSLLGLCDRVASSIDESLPRGYDAGLLRGLNRFKAMEAVRDLSWTTPSVFSSQDSEQAWMQEKAHTGFEPVPPP